MVIALSAYIQPFIMQGIWGHMHSVVAAHGDSDASRTELALTLRYGTRLAAAASCSVFVLGELLIRLAYTPDFLPALPYLTIYFTGEPLFIAISIYGAYLLSVGARSANLIGNVGYGTIILIGVTMLIAELGVWSYIVSHLTAVALIAIVGASFAYSRGQVDGSTLLAVASWIGVTVATGALAFWEQTHGRIGLTLVASSIVAALAMIPLVREVLAQRTTTD